MKLSIIGWHPFFIPIVNNLREKGHIVLFNRFNKDIDVLIVQNHCHYTIYKALKEIKKNNIKVINIILDLIYSKLQKDFYQNSVIRYFKQYLFDFSQRYSRLFTYISISYRRTGQIQKIFSNIMDTLFNPIYINQNKFLHILNNLFNTMYINRMYYQINYKKYLKQCDLNLSISKFTQKVVKKYLKIDTNVWYLGVDSRTLMKIPKTSKIEYDAINISKIIHHKRQEIFVKAAKILGLKIIIIGPHLDKKIKLNCPHYYLFDHIAVLRELNKARFYVDPSVYEGFGMTPVEAAFLEKISVVSDTYVHREVLGDYPLYFKRNNIEDLVKKMKMVINNEFKLNKAAVEKIKSKYALNNSTTKLLECIQSIL